MRTINFDNLYWQYSYKFRKLIDKRLKGKDTWTLNIEKDKRGHYRFSLPWFGVIRESLCNGTEHCIDHHAERLLGRPVRAGERLTFVVSSKPLEDATTTLQWSQADPLGPTNNYYVDTVASKDQGKVVLAWLCGLLQPLFNGTVPETLWVKVCYPRWKRDRLKYIFLPFEDPEHHYQVEKRWEKQKEKEIRDLENELYN